MGPHLLPNREPSKKERRTLLIIINLHQRSLLPGAKDQTLSLDTRIAFEKWHAEGIIGLYWRIFTLHPVNNNSLNKDGVLRELIYGVKYTTAVRQFITASSQSFEQVSQYCKEELNVFFNQSS